jgi:integrase
VSPRRAVLYSGGSRGDRVKAVLDTQRKRAEVLYRDSRGQSHKKVFADDREGRRAAIRWAEAYHNERMRIEESKRKKPDEPLATSHQQLWDAYASAPAFTDLRATSKIAYRGRFQKWLVFRKPESPVDQTTLFHVDQFITAARAADMAINQIRQVLNVVRLVYNWGQQRKLVGTNEMALHRWKRPKDAKVNEPAEYAEAEFTALLRVLNPQTARSWRPWVALMLAGHHGQRANAVLHLRWEDVDFEEGAIVWPADFQKNGEPLVHPMTWEAIAAFRTAREWVTIPTGREWTKMNHAQRVRAEQLSRSPWVLPSHGKNRQGRNEPWSYQALWLALSKAELAAKVEHLPYRAVHGFRKMVAGDVADRTGDDRLGMEWIGDRDMKQQRAYLKRRKERLDRAAGVMETKR